MFVCRFVGGVKCHTSKDYQRGAAGIVLDSRGRRTLTAGIIFYGIDDEVELACDLFQELRVTIAAMARLRWGGVYKGDGREYCEGFVTGLFSKTRENATEAERIAQTAGGTALMVIERRGALIEAKQAAADKWLGVKLGKGRSRGGATHYNGEARGEGRSDGAKHNTSAGRTLKIGGH